MKLSEIASQLNIEPDSLNSFIEDFQLDISDCLKDDLSLQPDFEKFLKEYTDFLMKYDADLNADKSPADISSKINQPEERVAEVLSQNENTYENGIYKTSVSSFLIDKKLGGDYNFIYKYFDQSHKLSKFDFIGYRDLFFYITDILDLFINETETENWGIKKPAAIVIYGPPGSGKIYWARKISDLIKYHFTDVQQNLTGNTLLTDKNQNLETLLMASLSEKKMALFLENFDELMKVRKNNSEDDYVNEDFKRIVLQSVSKFQAEDVVMLGSANLISNIDTEVLAPGRFDVLIPVFPPNFEERAELILYHLTKNLREESHLIQILKKNKADNILYWKPSAAKMKAFSNTMIIDFTQSLKKKIRKQYLRDKTNFKLTEKILSSALKEASSKLSNDYLDLVEQFVRDAKINNGDDFPKRISELTAELQFYKSTPKNSQPIGFTHNA